MGLRSQIPCALRRGTDPGSPVGQSRLRAPRVREETEVVQESLHETFARRRPSTVSILQWSTGSRHRLRCRHDSADSNPIAVPTRCGACMRAIRRHSRNRAERACTHWRVIGRDGGRAALLVRLETGKKHQIRVHLSELGCPIVGDRIYGGPSFQRLLLHAALLCFQHPITGAQVLTISGPDPAFRRAFPRLPDLYRRVSTRGAPDIGARFWSWTYADGAHKATVRRLGGVRRSRW